LAQLRIGVLIPSLHGRGGAEPVARAWIRQAIDRGHEVVALVYESHAAAPVDLPCQTEVFGRQRVVDRWLRLPDWVRATSSARRLDVVVGVLDFSNIVLLRAFRGRLDRPALVISEHSVPDVYWNYDGTGGRVKRQLARRLYRRADAAIAVSHAVATDLRVGLGVAADKIFVVPNTITVDGSGAARLRVSGSARRVLLVGRLCPVKRAERLLDTVAELARRGGDWCALVIGDGPTRPQLEEDARRRRLPMHFAGWQEPWQQLARPGDCLLLTSDIEGFGNVLVEAAAAGVASVAPSSALGVADAVIPGLTGVLACSARATDLADALEHAAELTWDSGDIAGWLANFSPAATVERFEAVLRFATGAMPAAGRSAARSLPVTHVGPGPGAAGGMSSIIGDYADMPFNRYCARFRPSWSATSPLWSLGPFLQALTYLTVMPSSRLGVVNVHVSKDGSFAREGMLVLISAARRLPTVVTLHGGRFPEFQTRHRRLVGAVLGAADRIVALGNTARRALPESLQPRAVVVPNAVALPAQAGPPPASCPPTALFAGEVTQLKGVDTLVAAWPAVRERVPEARLVIVGPPGDVVPVDLPGVEWRGLVGREEVQRLLQQCRVAVLPSREEAMPMFVLEAMAASRPVVATPVGEVAELVADAGRLIGVGDCGGLAAAIVELLSDGELASRVGAVGRTRIESRYGVQHVAQELERVYDQARCIKASRARLTRAT